MQEHQLSTAEKMRAEISEAELLAATMRGDRYAFQQLYQAHCGRVYALSYRLAADQGMAEDITQEVFIQVWRKLGDFRAESKFSTWLHAITVNCALAAMRKQKSWLARLVTSHDTENTAAEELHGDELDLDKYMARLPQGARTVFVLHAVEGYRHEEIAAKLNMAVGTSKSQFARAKALLQQWIEI